MRGEFTVFWAGFFACLIFIEECNLHRQCQDCDNPTEEMNGCQHMSPADNLSSLQSGYHNMLGGKLRKSIEMLQTLEAWRVRSCLRRVQSN